MVAHLRKGETYADLACGFRIGTSTVYGYIREALELLAATAPTPAQAIEVTRRKAFVILDGTLLCIDRVGMTSGYDRAFYSGKHKAHGLNVQVVADPIGRLVGISPPLPGARHDMGAAREHGIIDALATARDPRGGRHRLSGRRADGRISAAAPSEGSGHRPLPAPVPEPEGRQHRPRPPPWTRRAGQRRAEELAGPAEDPLQPEHSPPAHRRSSDPHDRQRMIRLAKAQ